MASLVDAPWDNAKTSASNDDDLFERIGAMSIKDLKKFLGERNVTPDASIVEKRELRNLAYQSAGVGPPAKPLPAGWAKFVDPSDGTPYYHCRATGETSWDFPEAPAAAAAPAAAEEAPPPAKRPASAAAKARRMKKKAEAPPAAAPRGSGSVRPAALTLTTLDDDDDIVPIGYDDDGARRGEEALWSAKAEAAAVKEATRRARCALRRAEAPPARDASPP